jgi:tetratricopeptide (TPR) repeat protein
MIVGRPEEAMAMIRRALDLDPFNVTIHSFYVQDLVFARHFDDAIVEAQKTLQMQPDNAVALAGRSYAYAAKGMSKETLEALKDYLRIYQIPNLETAMDRGFAEAGFTGAIRRAADMFAALSKEYLLAPTDVAYLYIYAGDKERALEWLERAYEARDPNLPYLRQPQYDPLRSEPRFQEIFRRMQL